MRLFIFVLFLLVILLFIIVAITHSTHLRFKATQPIGLFTAFKVLYFIAKTGWTHPYNGSRKITMIQTFMFYNVYVDRLATNYKDAKLKYVNSDKDSMQIAKTEYIKTLKQQQTAFGHKD